MSQILNVYSLYDEKAKCFMFPLYEISDGVAVRTVQKLLKSGNMQMPFVSNPEDFTLYKVAQMDDSTGVYTDITPNEMICKLSSLLES